MAGLIEAGLAFNREQFQRVDQPKKKLSQFDKLPKIVYLHIINILSNIGLIISYYSNLHLRIPTFNSINEELKNPYNLTSPHMVILQDPNDASGAFQTESRRYTLMRLTNSFCVHFFKLSSPITELKDPQIKEATVLVLAGHGNQFTFMDKKFEINKENVNAVVHMIRILFPNLKEVILEGCNSLAIGQLFLQAYKSEDSNTKIRIIGTISTTTSNSYWMEPSKDDPEMIDVHSWSDAFQDCSLPETAPQRS